MKNIEDAKIPHVYIRTRVGGLSEEEIISRCGALEEILLDKGKKTGTEVHEQIWFVQGRSKDSTPFILDTKEGSFKSSTGLRSRVYVASVDDIFSMTNEKRREDARNYKNRPDDLTGHKSIPKPVEVEDVPQIIVMGDRDYLFEMTVLLFEATKFRLPPSNQNFQLQRIRVVFYQLKPMRNVRDVETQISADSFLVSNKQQTVRWDLKVAMYSHQILRLPQLMKRLQGPG